MSTGDLLDSPVTDRDWQARAWERMRDVRATHQGWTLDQALEHPAIGRVVRAFGSQLKRQALDAQKRAEKEAKFGRKVVWNGYGYVPVGRERTRP